MEWLRHLLGLPPGTAEGTRIAAQAKELGDAMLLLARDGDYEAALRAAERSIPLLHRLWDFNDLARAYNNAGDLSRQLGRRRQAVHHYRQGLKWWKRIGDARGQAMSRRGIGEVLLDAEPDRAREELRRASDLFTEARDDAGLCDALESLVLACSSISRDGEAREHAEELLAVSERLQDKERIAEALYLLGGAQYRCADYAASIASLRRADSAFGTLGNDSRRVEVLEALCEALAAQQLHADALECLEQALALAKKSRDSALECRLRNHLGVAQERAGFVSEAQATFQQALDLVRNLPPSERQREQADILMNLGLWSMRRDDYKHARDYADRANKIFEALHDYPGSLNALRLSARAAQRGQDAR